MEIKINQFIEEWHQEAENIRQNDMFYDIETYADELWVTQKEFEDDLKKNHNRYEKKIANI